MAIFYKHKTSLMHKCKRLVFLFLFIIVIVIVISYYIFIYFIIHLTFCWPKYLRWRKFCSLFNRKICVASLAQLLPSLSLGTNWRLSPKSPLLKKLNGSVSNQFATCSACGTRLLRKLKHPRLLLQVPFYLKFSPVF